MFDTKLTPPTFDQATVDHYVAKGRRERSLAFAALIRAIFSGSEAAKAPASGPKTACA